MSISVDSSQMAQSSLIKYTERFLSLKETHLTFKNRHHHLRVEGWENVFPANQTRNQTGIYTLLSKKVYFKLKIKYTDKEENFILIRGTIYKEDSTLRTDENSSGIYNFIFKISNTFFKIQLFPNYVIVSNFCTPHSPIDRPYKEKISSNKYTN